MAKYLVASEAGAEWTGAEIGAEVERELNPDQERAVIAAGWVVPSDTKQKEQQ